MTLKIEEGKYYRTRDGSRVGPMQKGDAIVAFRGQRANVLFGHIVVLGYSRDGTHYYGFPGHDRHDLIAEWTDEPARPAFDPTRNDKPCALMDPADLAALKAHGGPWEKLNPLGEWIDCGPPDLWCVGLTYRAKPAPALVPDTIPWDALADWLQWVARDESGTAWAYDTKPRQGNTIWSCVGDKYGRIDDVLRGYVRGTVPWDQSLQERPK